MKSLLRTALLSFMAFKVYADPGKINLNTFNKVLSNEKQLTSQTRTIFAPTITIVSPTSTHYASGSDIILQVNASDPNGISKVELYIDNTLSTTWTSAPYSITAANTAAGNYVIKFIAYNTLNQTSTTGNITLIVEETTNSAWNSSGNFGLSSLNFLGTRDNLPLIVKANDFEHLRLLPNGNLGLGLTNPSYKLDVSGTGRFSNLITSGKIAIGTTIDSVISDYALAVNGTGVFKKIKVQIHDIWPDYVFEPSQKLLPLKKVEEYITANKHLPEMPSAKEVQTDGLDMATNQGLLLKKIEELTLYLIQQNKVLQKQQVEINKLKKKNQ